jgi:hypothetical protein
MLYRQTDRQIADTDIYMYKYEYVIAYVLSCARTRNWPCGDHNNWLQTFLSSVSTHTDCQASNSLTVTVAYWYEWLYPLPFCKGELSSVLNPHKWLQTLILWVPMQRQPNSLWEQSHFIVYSVLYKKSTLTMFPIQTLNLWEDSTLIEGQEYNILASSVWYSVTWHSYQ